MTGEVRINASPPSGSLSETIEHELLASLRKNIPASGYAPLTFAARDEDGELVGGLDGSTAFGWLLVKALWVAEKARDRGLGTRLMQSAETEAVARGCHGAWLDTSSANAERLYRRLGYTAFGALENGGSDPPAGHTRFFMSKRF